MDVYRSMWPSAQALNPWPMLLPTPRPADKKNDPCQANDGGPRDNNRVLRKRLAAERSLCGPVGLSSSQPNCMLRAARYCGASLSPETASTLKVSETTSTIEFDSHERR